MRRESKRFVAVDSQGYAIHMNDNMKETEGELREGRVLHVHQSHYAFLHNRSLLESGGVFVTRAMGLVSVSPRFRSHQSAKRRLRRPSQVPILLPPDPYAGGASPAWECYSNTPAASPYVGTTPAWNPNARTLVGSPCAGDETPAPSPHPSFPDYYAFEGGVTPTWASTEWSGDERPMLDMDLSDNSSDPYGKFSTFIDYIHKSTKASKHRAEFAPDWQLELADLIDISELRVRIKGTLEEKYLDGKYESLLVHIVSTETANSCFEYTALARFDSTSEECNLLLQYLVPDAPSKQDQLAVVLHESKQGHKVRVKQRPNEDIPTEQLVVESLMNDGPSFWECQKDWMCALW